LKSDTFTKSTNLSPSQAAVLGTHSNKLNPQLLKQEHSALLRKASYAAKQANLGSDRPPSVQLAYGINLSHPYSNAGDGSIHLNRREFPNVDFTFDAKGEFKLEAMSLNPGNSVLFPWGYKIGRLYERFEYHGIDIEWHPACESIRKGLMAIVYDPDPLDDPPTNFQNALNAPGAVVFSPWAASKLHIPRRILGPAATNAKLVQVQDGLAADYQHTAGKIYLLSEGGDDSTICGMLSVSYSLALHTPQLHDHTDQYLHAYYQAATPPSGTDLFASYNHYEGSTLLDEGVTLTGNSIVFPASVIGYFGLIFRVKSDTTNSGMSVNPTISSPLGISAFHPFVHSDSATIDGYTTINWTASRECLLWADVHIDHSETTITIGDIVTLNAGTGWDLVIYRLPPIHATTYGIKVPEAGSAYEWKASSGTKPIQIDLCGDTIGLDSKGKVVEGDIGAHCAYDPPEIIPEDEPATPPSTPPGYCRVRGGLGQDIFAPASRR